MNGIKETDRVKTNKLGWRVRIKKLYLGLSDYTKAELFPTPSGKIMQAQLMRGPWGNTEAPGKKSTCPAPRVRHQEQSGCELLQSTLLPDRLSGGRPLGPARARRKVGRQEQFSE